MFGQRPTVKCLSRELEFKQRQGESFLKKVKNEILFNKNYRKALNYKHEFIQKQMSNYFKHNFDVE